MRKQRAEMEIWTRDGRRYSLAVFNTRDGGAFLISSDRAAGRHEYYRFDDLSGLLDLVARAGWK